jgi:signal transduction histidine kinase
MTVLSADTTTEPAGPGTEGGIALAARIHDRVVPRLSGVAMVLGADGRLAMEDQRRCHDEVTAALGELRALVWGSVEHAAPSLDQELREWRAMGVPLRLTRVEAMRVPDRLEPLVRDVLHEAVGNAMRHGRPSHVDVRIEVTAEHLVLSVVSDGAARSAPTAGLGLGLRLVAAVAGAHKGRVEWGPQGESEWTVRLTVPMPAS